MSEEATTPDFVELTRKAFGAASRRDFDAMMAFWSRDPVWDVTPMGLGSYRGRAAVRGFFEDWLGSYERFTGEVEECVDLGHGVVLSTVKQTARLAGSGGELTIRYSSVGVWEDALIVSVTNYSDAEAARAAAQLLAEERS